MSYIRRGNQIDIERINGSVSIQQVVDGHDTIVTVDDPEDLEALRKSLDQAVGFHYEQTAASPPVDYPLP